MPLGKRHPAVDPSASVAVKDLDLTSLPLEEDKANPDYSTDAKREDTRKRIAYGLLMMLAGVSVAWVLLALSVEVPAEHPAVGALDKIFAGILALTGTAVGFYFGASSNHATATT